MNAKEKLYFLLKEFKEGRYDTSTFCDLFTITYDIEVDYEELSALENKLFGELSVITARYSPFEEDLKIRNVYYDEQKVRSEVERVLNTLIQNGKGKGFFRQ